MQISSSSTKLAVGRRLDLDQGQDAGSASTRPSHENM
jgi:hypothetical protein